MAEPREQQQQQPKPKVDYNRLRVVEDPEAVKTDRLISELNDLMRQVRREYDLWFNGTVQKPPYELRNRLDTHVRLLRRRLPKRTVDQFRIGTVLTQYQSLAEHWDKSIRKQEEGGAAPWMASTRKNPLDALRDANEERAQRDEEAARRATSSAYLARITQPEADVDEMKRVFNSYVAAKKKVGDDVGAADFEKFRQVLVKQTKSLIDSGKASAVAYRIEIQAGKVSIKAKAEK